MIKIYCAIDKAHRSGNRAEASKIFRQLLPVLAFSNQDLLTIAFFKRLLVRRGIFANENIREGEFEWDAYNTRVADELIEVVIQLEASLKLNAKQT